MDAEQETNLDIALQRAQTAKSQLPDLPQVNDTLGWIYHLKGLNGEAVAPLQQSVNKDPNNASYQYHLGTAFAAVGKVPEAQRALQRALSLKLPADQAAKAQKALADLK
jgi:tetratricopeptide (TPR) repeat protein